MTADGANDPTFGTDGRAVTEFFAGASFQGGYVSVLPDGRVVAAGTTAMTNQNNTSVMLALARFDLNGSLDPSFASGGWPGAPGFGHRPRDRAVVRDG